MRNLFFILVVSVFFSCKKDKKCNQDMSGMSGTYVVTAVKYKSSAAAAEMDYYNQVYTDACQKDDRATFQSNGTYVFTDAGVKCVPPGDYTGTWTVNGAVFTMDGDIYSVQNFDCSGMVITALDFYVAGDQLKLTLTRQ